MKLEELVSYFRKGNSFEEFCQLQSLNKESEVIGIYMTMPFSLTNELNFFEYEEAGDKIEYMKNGISYHELFDFYYFLDVIEELSEEANRTMTNEKVAQVLLSYAINDA